MYVPHGSDWSFCKHIFELMITKIQGVLICDGDFNIRLNPKKDLSNGQSDSNNLCKRLNKLMTEAGIIDVWRERNPTNPEYTYYSSAHKVYSRIDYFTSRKDLCTLWRLNSNILNNPTVTEKIKTEIRSYLNHNDNEEVMPPIL